jgi:hypothetical protein
MANTKELAAIPFYAVDRVNERKIITCTQQTWTFSNPLTTEHSDILYGTLSFSNPSKTEQTIKADFNVFCRRIYNRSDENIRQKSIQILNDFKDTSITITQPDKTTRTFKIIDTIKISEHNIHITLTHEYCTMLNNPNLRIVEHIT